LTGAVLLCSDESTPSKTPYHHPAHRTMWFGEVCAKHVEQNAKVEQTFEAISVGGEGGGERGK